MEDEIKCVCNSWNENMPNITSFFILGQTHGMKYNGETFNYCPWCGKSLKDISSGFESIKAIEKYIKDQNSIFDDFETLINDRWRVYQNLLKDNELSYCRGYASRVILDEDIRVFWEDSWQYGGYDSGEDDIPKEWLLDTNWKDVMKISIKKLLKIKEEKFLYSKNLRKKSFEKLKKEFE